MNNGATDGTGFICSFRLLLLLVCFFWSFGGFSVFKTGKKLGANECRIGWSSYKSSLQAMALYSSSSLQSPPRREHEKKALHNSICIEMMALH